MLTSGDFSSDLLATCFSEVVRGKNQWFQFFTYFLSTSPPIIVNSSRRGLENRKGGYRRGREQVGGVDRWIGGYKWPT